MFKFKSTIIMPDGTKIRDEFVGTELRVPKLDVELRTPLSPFHRWTYDRYRIEPMCRGHKVYKAVKI